MDLVEEGNQPGGAGPQYSSSRSFRQTAPQKSVNKIEVRLSLLRSCRNTN